MKSRPLDYQTPSHPTHIRHAIIGITAFAAFLMYLDRICLSQMVTMESFHRYFGFTKQQTGNLLGVFFFAYALMQLPAGWLADRFGARPLMTIFIALWSAFTFMTGCATGFWTLVLSRIGCGIAEAGAYPASGSLISRWVPLRRRGLASSIVAGGGRLGLAFAPWLTAVVIVGLGNWRFAGWIFGGVGIVFAWVFWSIFRERPSQHPLCNSGERDLIERDLPLDQISAIPRRGLPLGPLVRSRGMWLMCLNQFLSNIGWVFLATLMPTYLREVKGLGEVAAGRTSSIALFIGIGGMVTGGWLTDFLTRHFGVRQGRIIPMAWSRFIAAAAYISCMKIASPWACAAVFALITFMGDVSVAAAWAYVQDVGGRNVAAALAWPNMFGNIGAAITPPLLMWINAHFDPNHNWHAALIVPASAYALAGLVAFGIHADVKLIEPEPRGFPVIATVGGPSNSNNT